MHDHHKQTIENLRSHFEPDPHNLAFIVVGSVARGEAGEGSDLDFYLVVDEQTFADLSTKNAWLLEANEYCVAPCPEANGFAITISGLKELRDQGSELMR